MGHKINITNRGAAMYSAIEKPWHGLGVVTESAKTSDEVIKLAKLDYEVKKTEVFAYVKKDEADAHSLKVVPKGFATYRTDTADVFGPVGPGYEVVQNWEAFEFFDDLVGEKLAIFETAGALGKGETIFVTAKLPSFIQIDGDPIEKYLLFTMGHIDEAIEILFTPIRVVCWNTLSSALGRYRDNGARIKLRHTANVRDKLAEVKSFFGLVDTFSDDMAELLEASTKIKINDEDFDQYVKKAYNLQYVFDKKAHKYTDELTAHAKKVLNNAKDFYESGPGQNIDICRGTLYGGYQAITGLSSHSSRGLDKGAQMSNVLLKGKSHDTIVNAGHILEDLVMGGSLYPVMTDDSTDILI